MPDTIFKREIIDSILPYLTTDNIIVLHGARQVGKTHILWYLQNLLKSQGNRSYFFDLEDSRFVELLDKGVDAMCTYLKNEGFDLDAIKKTKQRLYLFIDEIQYIENPSSLLKLLVDHHKYFQLIVSGSSTFDIRSKFSDSLTGRTVNFEIYPLSFKEVLLFKHIPLDPGKPLSASHLTAMRNLYTEYVLYGGYPKIVLEDAVEKKEVYLQQIVDTYVRKDIRDLASISDIRKFNNLLKILASQSGNLVNISELSQTCALAKQTVERYLFLLEQTYIIRLVPPFSSNARVEVVKNPKVFFYDTGLLQILWLQSLQKTVIGNLFESSIFAELVKKYRKDDIYFWRTKNQQEIDFILRYKKILLPIEVKTTFRNTRERPLASFQTKYKTTKYHIVALQGVKSLKQHMYPWEIP